METKVRSEAIKTALASGNASSTTVETLRDLLWTDGLQAPAPIREPTTSRSKSVHGPTARPKNLGAKSKGRHATVQISNDILPRPSIHDQHRLATEIVNISLKYLSDVKTLSTAKTSSTATKHESEQTVNDATAKSSRKPLQHTSGNSAPPCPSPCKSRDVNASPVLPTEGRLSSTRIESTVQSAILALTFLRSSPKETPQLQLETGMLALIGKMITFDLYAIAIGELEALKDRLEQFPRSGRAVAVCQTSSKSPSNEIHNNNLAGLLQVRSDLAVSPELSPLWMTYCLHILRIVAAIKKPRIIEALVDLPHVQRGKSLINVILQELQASNNEHEEKDKAARQLSMLSGMLLSICPSPDASHDASAGNAVESLVPTAVFKIQVLALKARRIWWGLASHQANAEKDLVEPFSKCVAAFVRRYDGSDSALCHELIRESLETLELSEPEARSTSVGLLGVYKTLSALAQASDNPCAEQRWAELAHEACASFSCRHAQRLAALCRLTAVKLQTLSKATEHEPLKSMLTDICKTLGEQVTGSGADYEDLLVELAKLVHTITREGAEIFPGTAQLLCLAVTYAHKFARSYTTRRTSEVVCIVRTGMLHSDNTDALLSWLNQDTLVIFIQGGILKAIADATHLQPLHRAMTMSPDAIAFGQVISALLLKALRKGLSADFLQGTYTDMSDVEALCLLEWQLRCIIELSERRKYHATLQEIVPDVCRRLSAIHGKGGFPIREARIAIQISQLREGHSNLVHSDLASRWQAVGTVKQDDMAQDLGFSEFLEETNASLAIIRALADGTVHTEDVLKHLAIWSHIMDEEDARQPIDRYMYDRRISQSLMSSLAAYLGMLGRENMRYQVLELLHRMMVIMGSPEEQLQVILDLALQSIRLGYVRKAGSLLEIATTQAQEKLDRVVQRLQLHVVYVEYYLQTGDLTKAAQSLLDAEALRLAVDPMQVRRHERRRFEVIHAYVWHVQSRYNMASGNASQALAAARHSVRLWTSIWTGIEQKQGTCSGIQSNEPTNSAVDGLTAGVSKLNLERSEPAPHGASFWMHVAPFCDALLQLSNLYAHHGMFAEASHYCERAACVAGNFPGSSMLSRVLCHKCRLLVKAGQFEAAELCLVRIPNDSLRDDFFEVEIHRVRAEIHWSGKEFDNAIADLAQAESILSRLEQAQSGADVAMATPPAQTDNVRVKDAARTPAKSAIAKRHVKSIPSKQAVANPRKVRGSKRDPRAASTTCESPRAGENVICSTTSTHLRSALMHDKILCELQAGRDVDPTMLEAVHFAQGPGAFTHTRLSCLQSLQQMVNSTRPDACLNVLLDSALALPSCRSLEGVLVQEALSDRRKAKSSSGLIKGKVVKSNSDKAGNRSRPLVVTLPASPQPIEFGTSLAVVPTPLAASTWEMHSLAYLLSATAVVESAIKAQRGVESEPGQANLGIEFARSMALQCERRAVALECKAKDIDQPLHWPSTTPHPQSAESPGASFQQHYVDILPTTWTAVSMTLSDDCSELFVTRYRSHETPFMLRLPFARHHGDDEIDGQTFDFDAGKKELQDIIQLSNTTCHNGGDMTKKGARTGWWAQREMLDRRLHDLLINVERIWFGGFKGVLSDHVPHEQPMANFRRSFENILQHHLPSRKTGRSQQASVELDDHVLALFISLADKLDEEVDEDDALIDLLYFVLDTLQFHGEKNAYDEVDFDSMALEVREELQRYHEAEAPEAGHDRHVVLILDRQLQVFPWENLPCLQSTSVSRVGSMLALRDCIVAMNDATRHQVDRARGTYFLNPSRDLVSTQAALEPALSSLKTNGGQWTSVVQTAPDEETFSKALSDSSITLYFGHGAGSQYVRPRAIKKLDRCSEVVWLMGCSSGSITEYGQLEPFAVPHAYLLAGTVDEEVNRPLIDKSKDKLTSKPGASVQTSAVSKAESKCLAVVATLWDVTDKDIDRFSLQVGDLWGLWSSHSESLAIPHKVSKARERPALPSTPTQIPKTPKTPKVAKSAVSRTPIRSRTYRGRGDGQRCSLVAAVSQSRDTCYLRYLNGAAPVVYGVPVYLSD